MAEYRISGECDPTPGTFCGSHETFSLGIYPMISSKDGKRLKKGKVVVRVVGRTSDPHPARVKAQEIADKLTAGTYEGPKRVVVN